MIRAIVIILSTSLELDSCSRLQALNVEMNELYLSYSKQRFKPKFQFLTECHSLFKKCGSVIHLWSMRYEAKHSETLQNMYNTAITVLRRIEPLRL